eukprot:509696-Prorocentrum_minimum.AAC.4
MSVLSPSPQPLRENRVCSPSPSAIGACYGSSRLSYPAVASFLEVGRERQENAHQGAIAMNIYVRVIVWRDSWKAGRHLHE